LPKKNNAAQIQEIKLARKNLRAVRAADGVAQKVGESLGASQVLLRRL